MSSRSRVVCLLDKNISYNELRFFIMGEFWRENDFEEKYKNENFD